MMNPEGWAAVTLLEWTAVEPGQMMSDFRGTTWEFLGITRVPKDSSTGRVYMQRRCESYDSSKGECAHFWHREGYEQQEFFPSVFELKIIERPTE